MSTRRRSASPRRTAACSRRKRRAAIASSRCARRPLRIKVERTKLTNSQRVSIEVRHAAPDDDAFITALGSSCATTSVSRIRHVNADTAALSFRRLLMFCRERPGTIDLIAAVDGERAGFLILLTDVPDEV